MKALAVAIGWTVGTLAIVAGGAVLIFIQTIRYIVGYVTGFFTLPFMEPPPPPPPQPFEEFYWIAAAFVAGGFLIYVLTAWLITRR